MRRRDFIAATIAAAAWPAVARAQARRTRPLLGYLSTTSAVANPAHNIQDALIQGLRDLGYDDGRTIDFAYRWAEFHEDRLPVLARELIALSADLIVAETPPAAVAAHNATRAIPIVCPTLNEPVQLGLIASFAEPDSNVTGISTRVEGMSQKRLQILRELVPSATVIGLLSGGAISDAEQEGDIEPAAKGAGIKLVVAVARDGSSIPSAFAELREARAQALIISQNGLFAFQRDRIMGLAAEAKLPTMWGFPEDVDDGGLISYGTDITANFRRAAVFIDKILKGAAPARLPVEFPTKVILAINVKTAQALGLAIPQSLLATADQVIE